MSHIYEMREDSAAHMFQYNEMMEMLLRRIIKRANLKGATTCTQLLKSLDVMDKQDIKTFVYNVLHIEFWIFYTKYWGSPYHLFMNQICKKVFNLFKGYQLTCDKNIKSFKSLVAIYHSLFADHLEVIYRGRENYFNDVASVEKQKQQVRRKMI